MEEKNFIQVIVNGQVESAQVTASQSLGRQLVNRARHLILCAD